MRQETFPSQVCHKDQGLCDQRNHNFSPFLPHHGSQCGEMLGSQQNTVTHIHTSFHTPRTPRGFFFWTLPDTLHSSGPEPGRSPVSDQAPTLRILLRMHVRLDGPWMGMDERGTPRQPSGANRIDRPVKQGRRIPQPVRPQCRA